MKSAIVDSKSLGTNCWSLKRFCGGRCDKVMTCNYPEKHTCEAVKSEILYLENRREELVAEFGKRLEQLQDKISEGIRKLRGEE